jgi:hypothetical protein
MVGRTGTRGVSPHRAMSTDPAKIPDLVAERPQDALRGLGAVKDLPPAPKRLRPRTGGSRREQRSIARVRAAMAKLLEDNADKYQSWLEEAAKEHPLKALVLLKDLAEFYMPKLGRIEQTGTVEHKVSHFVPMIQREEPPAGYLGGKEGSTLEGEATEVTK